MWVRQNARQIRERQFYNGTTMEMVIVREIFEKSLYDQWEQPTEKGIHFTFPKYKITDRVKEVRKSFNTDPQK